MVEGAILVEYHHKMLDRGFRRDFMCMAMIAVIAAIALVALVALVALIALTGVDRKAARNRSRDRNYRCGRKKFRFHVCRPNVCYLGRDKLFVAHDGSMSV